MIRLCTTLTDPGLGSSPVEDSSPSLGVGAAGVAMVGRYTLIGMCRMVWPGGKSSLLFTLLKRSTLSENVSLRSRKGRLVYQDIRVSTDVQRDEESFLLRPMTAFALPLRMKSA